MKNEQFEKAKEKFMKANPDWKPEHGPKELERVFNHLLHEGQITKKTKPGRVANIIADFIS